MTLCSSVDSYQRFGKTYCLHCKVDTLAFKEMELHQTTLPADLHQIPRTTDTSTLKIDAKNMSEMLVTIVYARLHGVISHETTIFRFNLLSGACVTNVHPVSINTT